MSRYRFSRAFVIAGAITLAAPFVTPEALALASPVDDKRAEVAAIVDELDRLHTQADILAEDYNEAVDRERQLQEEIVDAEAAVAAKEAELSALRGDLAEVAVRAFTGAGTDVLGPLFSDAQTYTDGLRGDQYSRAALDAGTGTTDDLDETISELDEARQELEDLRAEAAELQATIADKQEQTEQLTAAYTERRAEAEAELGQLIEEEEQRRAAEAWARAQAEYAAQQQAAASASSGGGSDTGADSGGESGGSDAGSGGSGGGGEAPAAALAPVSDIPAVSGRAGVAISAAQSQLGVPYSYATSNPGVSFDCSGLTHYAWGQAGVYLPRNSRAQAAAVPLVPAGAAQPGDLIFYYSPISHVGIYLGGGSYIHAPATGDVVKISGVNWSKVTAVGRPG
jgi:cell wall-associated NlpC family hydrolase